MTSQDDRLPDRMRSYRVEAELRETPELHQLAQLFIGMALARTDQDPPTRGGPPPAPARGCSGEVDAAPKDASG